MGLQIRAIYRDRAFLVREPCAVPEGAEVDLIVQGPLVHPPKVPDADERVDILAQLVARMRRNPIPDEAPRWTREELHGRR